MNTTPTSFQSVLDTLLSDRPDFPRRYLQEFSDLGPLELKTLLDVWPRVKPSRKLTLLEDLDALAETDTLVSFDELARALLTDPEPDVRTRAIRLLDEYEDPKIFIIRLRTHCSPQPPVKMKVACAAQPWNLWAILHVLKSPR